MAAELSKIKIIYLVTIIVVILVAIIIALTTVLISRIGESTGNDITTKTTTTKATITTTTTTPADSPKNPYLVEFFLYLFGCEESDLYNYDSKSWSFPVERVYVMCGIEGAELERLDHWASEIDKNVYLATSRFIVLNNDDYPHIKGVTFISEVEHFREFLTNRIQGSSQENNGKLKPMGFRPVRMSEDLIDNPLFFTRYLEFIELPGDMLMTKLAQHLSENDKLVLYSLSEGIQKLVDNFYYSLIHNLISIPTIKVIKNFEGKISKKKSGFMPSPFKFGLDLHLDDFEPAKSHMYSWNTIYFTRVRKYGKKHTYYMYEIFKTARKGFEYKVPYNIGLIDYQLIRNSRNPETLDLSGKEIYNVPPIAIFLVKYKDK